ADDGELAGTVRLWNVEAGSAGPALLLGPIAIDERYRDQGIGSALMKHAIAQAKALGHRAIVLVGDEPYYCRFGFTRETVADLRLPALSTATAFSASSLCRGRLPAPAEL